jgi:hypothetical protein
MWLFLLSWDTGCLTSLAGLLLSWFVQSQPWAEHGRSGNGDHKNSPAVGGLGSQLHGSSVRHSSSELELPSSPEAPLIPRSNGSLNSTAMLAAEAEAGSSSSSPEVLGAPGSVPAATRPAPQAMGSTLLSLISSRGFIKYMAMCLFTVNLKTIFRHLEATLPKFQLRAYGCDAKVGLVYR